MSIDIIKPTRMQTQYARCFRGAKFTKWSPDKDRIFSAISEHAKGRSRVAHGDYTIVFREVGIYA